MSAHRKWVFWMGYLVVSTNALAQTDGSEPQESLEERERKLLDEGYSLRKQGKDAEALATYEHAFALRGDKKALAQMALAKVALGDWVQGYALLKQALSDREHPWILANRELLEGELDRIKKSTATLTLEVTPAGARVELNGHLLGAAPLAAPLMLNPGPALLDVSAREHKAYHGTLDLKQGQFHHEVVHLVRTAVPTPATERPLPATKASGMGESGVAERRNPLWLGAAIGGALVSVSAIVPWAMAAHQVRTLEDECRGQASCNFEGTRRTVNQLDILSNVLLFSGLAVTTASTAIYFTVTKEPSASKSGSPSARSSAFQLGYSGQF